LKLLKRLIMSVPTESAVASAGLDQYCFIGMAVYFFKNGESEVRTAISLI
jgi:hypothetical protein